MGNDMVNNCGWHNLSLALATNTQRMCCQEHLSGSLPPSVVTFLFCGFRIVCMEWGVFLTILRPIGNQLSTTGMLAWGVRSSWHSLLLPRESSLTKVTVSTDLVIIHI